jgi:hypothetical protein
MGGQALREGSQTFGVGTTARGRGGGDVACRVDPAPLGMGIGSAGGRRAALGVRRRFERLGGDAFGMAGETGSQRVKALRVRAPT